MHDPTYLKPSPEAEEAGRLYREAIKHAEASRYDDAIRSVEAIEETKFRLSFVFRNEALLEIVTLCCDAGEIEKASEVARQMDVSRYQKRAIEVIESYLGGG
jgi:hypothetical protein